jgi:hypothetical protein
MRKSSADQAPQPATVDHRLIGSWKSDAKRTIDEWRWGKRIPKERRNAFLKIFGKLEITYGRRWIHIRLNTWQTSQRYRLLASDETGVAIMTYGQLKIQKQRQYSPDELGGIRELASKPAIQHIHFDNAGYWISFGFNREFFKRLKPPALRQSEILRDAKRLLSPNR